MVKIRDAAGRVIHTSRNLRAIGDYSRGPGVYVERVDLFTHKHDDGGTLGVTWNTGATCLAEFASFAVMVAWAEARRNFKAATIKHAPRGLAYFINCDERGEFRADVRDMRGRTVWQTEGEVFDDGYMRHSGDLEGLAAYLRELGIMGDMDTLTKGQA